MGAPAIAVAPDTRPVMHAAFSDAVAAGGGRVVEVADAEALVWADPAAVDAFGEIIAGASGVRWIQLPYAGIEPFAVNLDARYLWTCGKGVYARPVAEHALALALAGMRGVGRYARAGSWQGPVGSNLLDADVTILGGGGIAHELIAMLAPFGCRVTVVRRHLAAMPGVDRVTGSDDLDAAVQGADLVVVAWALTPDTEGRIDAGRLALMSSSTWIVNVARGAHIVTADLVDALREGAIGGAALDVTDPEPLPDGHPLWSLGNCIITPHVGNTPEMGLPLIADRVRENVARFATGRDLLGTVDVSLGY